MPRCQTKLTIRKGEVENEGQKENGDYDSPYPRFPDHFSKNGNGILASQGNFKTVCISCGDEVRDCVFEKNFKKSCIRPS